MEVPLITMGVDCLPLGRGMAECGHGHSHPRRVDNEGEWSTQRQIGDKEGAMDSSDSFVFDSDIMFGEEKWKVEAFGVIRIVVRNSQKNMWHLLKDFTSLMSQI